jgi:pimeloyl-ACP methyl ester carboxylesterase
MLSLVVTIVGIAVAGVVILRFAWPERYVALLRGMLRVASRLKTRSIEADGETWRYLIGGPEGGDVILFLHGFGVDKDVWTLYARRFVREYRVIVPDLPGFGESSRVAGADYGIEAQARRLSGFVDALDLDRFHLAGNSMGGALALRFSLTCPERILTLALYDNAGVTGARKSELELAAERGESPLTVATPDEFDRLLAFVSERPIFFPRAVKQVMCAEAIAARGFLEETFFALFEEFRTRPLNDRLEAVRAPTLIIWGRQDRLIDVSCAEVMAARIPDNRCVVFEDTGHVPMLERPAEAAAAHLEFLRQQRVGPP